MLITLTHKAQIKVALARHWYWCCLA